MEGRAAMASARSVSTLPIANSFVEKLRQHGFHVVADIIGLEPLDLAQEVGISPDEALAIISSFDNSSSGSSDAVVPAPSSSSSKDVRMLSAKDILTKFGSQRSIVSFCKAIDTMLGGGVQVGQITEFCGVPGIGKTQLAIQLALNAQIPEIFHGVAGEAVYIDTEGSFMVERAAEMATELSTHLLRLARGTTRSRSQEVAQSQISIAEGMTMERFLEGIHVFRPHDQTETVSIITHLEAFLKLRTRVKLILIDSIAFPFRQDIFDTSTRSRVLSSIAQQLNKYAFTHSLAVVVINHVTTRFDRRTQEQSRSSFPPADASTVALQRLVPALGEQWSHCVTNRVMLHWQRGEQRMATLAKSPRLPLATAPFCINQKGVRDIQDVLARERKRKANALIQQEQHQQQQQNQN